MKVSVTFEGSLLKATGIRQKYFLFVIEKEVGNNCQISQDAVRVNNVSVLTRLFGLAANTWEHQGFRSLRINISRLSLQIRKPLLRNIPA